MVNTSPVTNNSLDLSYFLSFLDRRKWIIIFLFTFVLALCEIYLIRSPKLYRAQVVLSIVPQKVPSSYIRSTVSTDMEAFIHSIWQEITSRTNLERLIKEYNLYPDITKNLPMETVIEKMRKAIKVSRPRGGKRNVFIISFDYYDPQIAAKVVNNIANIFIEQNLKLREEQAKTVASFLDEELKRIELELKKREKAIQEYKKKYMAELPEQKDSIIAILSRLQKESETLQMRKEMLEDRRVSILDQLKKMEEEASLSENLDNNSVEPSSLSKLERIYMVLRMKYTDKHPDVIRVKKLIKERKKQLDVSSSNILSKNFDVSDPVSQLKFQLRNIDEEIKRIEEANKKILQKIKIYQARLENIPKREQELKDLTRDYSNLMNTYRMLLDKKIQATMAQTLEKRQQGEQFKIIDPARIPEVPVSPNIKKTLIMGMLLALFLSLGLCLLLEFFFDKKVYDPSVLENQLDIKVLAIIPMVMTSQQKRLFYLKNLFLATLAILSLSVNFYLFLKIVHKMQI